jgi:glutaconate CoA-transferase subunit A
MPAYTDRDKVTDLEQAVARVADGATVALGGALSYREPMALVRELVRQGRRDLRLVGSAHGIDVDMLVAAGVAAVVEESYVGYEQDLGLAPAYRRAAESGAVAVRETCCYTLLQQLRAAEYGIPFMPVRGVGASDVRGLHPEYGEVECPFTGERLVAAPALAPDVALIHAPIADERGNVHIERPLVLDERFAFASRATIVTAERIVPESEVSTAGIVLPYFTVAAVVEARYGAHPTSCYPDYAYDRAHLARWVEAAASDDGARSYLDGHVRGATEADYVDAIGGDRLRELGEWSQSDARWMELVA